MDADHRNELKVNDLADFLANLGPWWGKYGNTLLIAILVIAAVLLGKRFFEARTTAVQEEAWADLAQATSPESYRMVAQSHSLPAVRALADLRGADLWLAKAASPQPAGDTSDVSSIHVTAQQALDEAALLYERVANDPQTHPLFRFNAQLGLAAVAEGRKDWARARQLYTSIIEQAGAGYEAIAAQAKARRAQLDRLARPVIFGPDPQPPASQPATSDDTTSDSAIQPSDSDIAAPIDTGLP